MKKGLYLILLICSVLMLFGGISVVFEKGVSVIDTIMLIFFLSLTIISFLKLLKSTNKNYLTENDRNTIHNQVSPAHYNKNKSQPKIEVNIVEKTQEIDRTNIIKDSKIDKNYESKLSVYDILILHLNSKRLVGKELTNHFLLIEKQIDTMSHIENLLKNDVLSIKRDFNHSLNYLKIPELKSILRTYSLKVSGNKPELIQRIKENISEGDIDLPQVYVATCEGEKLIEDTNYVTHFFYRPYIVNLAVAHKLVENQYNITDKIEFIYLKLIENNEKNIHETKNIVHNLTHYYKSIKKDKLIVRKYTNYGIYLGFAQSLEHLKFNIRNWFVERKILDIFYIDSESLEYYEDLLLVEDINLSVLKKIFFADVSSFVSVSEKICNDFCEILIAHVNENSNISINELPAIRGYYLTSQ
ncbi:SAP domain-containing protein [Staphylococcus aureus]|uniref:SAP domain-containing protein n=1 Tax=Staphylococcus aureus TaxID=1280 RepID=UPI001C66CB97|nr:SAP domain-containing protein [Staphylococcus aureus]MBW8216635.1 SAP domain-containing protein [Staphylococcus aureus]MBW8237662.1 SAP domain-containing protein [Staphylococcus aureus]MCF0293016.1 SAP domain-containing protein [Staphylococcus aureus]MDT3073204.1 SAP domain-containing protein [Staphylococcus aureus]UTW27947.1 SAP domain protein [Staphylococcus aureus]